MPSVFARRPFTGAPNDALPRVRLRLVLAGYGSFRAPERRLLHMAALLQRRDRRTAPHPPPGPHAVRDPGSNGDEAAWVDKADFLRHAGGMAMIDTHPDYLIDERILSAYARFVERFADDPTAWSALPREINSWWRRRAESWLEHDGSAWRGRRTRPPTRAAWRSRREPGESRCDADITTRARAFLHIGPDHTVTSPAKPQQARLNRRWRARSASEGCPLSQRASWQAGRAASRCT